MVRFFKIWNFCCSPRQRMEYELLEHLVFRKLSVMEIPYKSHRRRGESASSDSLLEWKCWHRVMRLLFLHRECGFSIQLHTSPWNTLSRTVVRALIQRPKLGLTWEKKHDVTYKYKCRFYVNMCFHHTTFSSKRAFGLSCFGMRKA